MGCCWSLFCKDDNLLQNGDANERTHLLNDPVLNNININRVNSDDILSRNFNELPKNPDGEGVVTGLLHGIATKVIDVQVLDSHSLQQYEYMERVKLYNLRVHQILTSNRAVLGNKLKKCILQDVPHPEKVLSANLIGSDDVDLISSALLAADSAINDIKVDLSEDLMTSMDNLMFI